MKRIAFVILILSIFAVPSTMAQWVIPADSVIYGRTYSEWSAEWWQWALSIPVATHPLFDKGDCSVGQSGPVWFLGGSFASNTDVRSCTVPAGKMLFFPILNGEDSDVEESFNNGCSDPTFGSSIVGLRRCATAGQEGLSVRATIDGVAVPNIARTFRFQSPAFSFTIPDDNLFKATTGNPYLAGTYLSVGDGYYLMLSPLSQGKHTIHFKGSAPNGFTLDITYHLTVAK